jgi:hypothetical protein
MGANRLVRDPCLVPKVARFQRAPVTIKATKTDDLIALAPGRVFSLTHTNSLLTPPPDSRFQTPNRTAQTLVTPHAKERCAKNTTPRRNQNVGAGGSPWSAPHAPTRQTASPEPHPEPHTTRRRWLKQQFRGGLVVKARRRLYHSTLGREKYRKKKNKKVPLADHELGPCEATQHSRRTPTPT